jgi:hypothetical protein
MAAMTRVIPILRSGFAKNPPSPRPSPPLARGERVQLVRVHHSGSPPEEKLRISLSTLSTPRQHFTTNAINPNNNNTLALRRRLSPKPTPLPAN